jgi:hypothetical protein
MSKSKVQRYLFRKLIQKGYVLAGVLAIVFGWIGMSQALVSYTPGSAFSGVTESTDYNVVNDTYQSNWGADFYAEVLNAQVTNNIVVSPGIGFGSTVNINEISASVLGNTSTLSTDLATVSAIGAIGGAASVNAQENVFVTAYSRVSASSITSNIVNPVAASSASLSGNSILAETGLNKTSQTVDGELNLIFNSSYSGTATLSIANPAVITGDAGLFVGSGQINSSVDSDVSPAFARVDGANTIGLTVSGTLGNGLSLQADNNSISAAFTGNNAKNLLSVETGGATALTSSAGIANLQLNADVNGETNSAVIEAGSSISASIRTNPVTDPQILPLTPFVDSSLSFDKNQLSASATGNVADNRLQIESGLNVAADGTQANSLDFTAANETATTSGGLFLNNMQLAIDSAISATAIDPANSAALSVDSRGLISSALTADGNSFEAIALGNDAYSSILVGGATSFNSAVAASNLQAVNNSAVSATANGGTLAVNLGGSAVGGGTTAVDDITGSTISVNGNKISALAVANRDPLLVNITGTTVTDGGTTLPVLTEVNNSATTMESTAGFSAISSQSAATSSVTASNTGGGVNLLTTNYPIAGATGSHVSDSTFMQTGNSISSLANLNEGLVAMGISANDLDASTAVASVQNATTSNVSATTSGTIITGINTRQGYPGDTIVGNSNLSVLVGDGDLSDKVYDGNTISATAGGNLNATALDAMASTSMHVTNVIDMDGAPSNVLTLSSAAAGTNQTLAEMSVLTDQRLATSAITATTDVSQIAGVIRASTYALSDSILNVDGNQVTATARGNLTTNSLDFSALSVDMSAAETGTPSTAAGSNLASMGSIQVIGPNSSVTAQINAAAPVDATNTNAEILGKIAGRGNRTNIALSVDNNSVVAAATGSEAISNLSGSGGSLAQDVPNNLYGTIEIGASPTTALSIYDTAIANAVVQSNAGSVSANLATTQVYDIDADIEANDTANVPYRITNSVITADNNRAVALATGLSADAGTVLAFNTLESSAATAVQQAQSGITAATVGGSGGGVTFLASTQAITPLAAANLINTTISASGNTAGAQATGATATTSLAAGGDNTVTLASGYGNATPFGGAYARFFAAGPNGTQTSGDYMLTTQQNISGATTAGADDLSVYVQSGRFAGGSLNANDNFLTAQATGGASTADLSLKANDITAGGIGANTVNAALSSDQRLSGEVSAILTASDVTVTAINLTTAANGVNSAEAISVNDNTLLASGIGISSANALNTDAITSAAGDISGTRTSTMDTGGFAVSGWGWDRLIVSNQDISATGAVTVSVSDLSVSAAVTGSAVLRGDIEGDTLTVDNNTLLAQGTGGSSNNSLVTTAGTTIDSLSQAIVARQASAGTVTVANTTAEAILEIGSNVNDIYGNSINSNLSVSGNQLAALATSLSGSNTISMSAPASITDVGDTLPSTFNILSQQTLADTAEVSASLTDSLASLFINSDHEEDNINNSLKVDGNIQEASAKGATSSNSLSADSGALGTATIGPPDGVGFSINAIQTSAAPISATNSGSYAELTINDGYATGSSLNLTGNGISATASNLTGANTLAAISGTANYGDNAVLSYDSRVLPVVTSADRIIISRQDVSQTGAVSATVNDAYMQIYVDDDVNTNSTAYLTGNAVAATATIAANSNTLTNSAETFLTSSSLITAVQTSAANATADNLDATLDIEVNWPVTDSSASLSNNQVTASATGLSAINTLNATAGSMQGSDAFGSITADSTGHTIRGFSAISSEQTVAGAISATVDTPDLYVSVSGEVVNSTVRVDSNTVQASAIAASAVNTLMQLTGTSMADAPALLAATQTICCGATATVSAATINIDTEYVDASRISADKNTIQAVATGGTMTNFIDPASGTSQEFFGGPDPGVNTLVSQFDGTYGLVSRQTSTAPVTATIDDYSEITMYIDDDIYDNSALSVSNNIMRTQATNLSTDNGIVTKAATALNNVTSGILSYQDVTGETRAITSGSDVWVEGYDLTGLAAVNSNRLVAIATGGTSTNKLTVSGLSVFGADVDDLSVDSSLSTTSIVTREAISGADSLASLLNVQTRAGAVIAEQNNIDGDLEISASFDNITGSVSVSNNLMAAEARGLVANNILSLTSQTVIDGGSSALGSVQFSNAAVTATLNSADDDAYIALWTDDVTGKAILDGNVALASATSNLAINSLTATAGTQMLNLGSNTVTSIGVPISAATVGFALQNAQSGSAVVNSSITSMNIESELAVLSGAASVDNNTVLSQSRGQAAQNSLVLNAGTTLEASASLVNAQSNFGNITAAIDTGAITLNANEVTGTTSVSGNKVQASSTANLALNSMDIAGTLVASSGGSTGANTATADFVALNYQSNLGANVGSSINNFAIGLTDTVSTKGAASVLNNAILADATGNSSTNSFTIKPTGGSQTADFAFNGYQGNFGGSVSSSISGATISLTSAGGSGTFRATGNRIGATSIGNSSISSIKSGL